MSENEKDQGPFLWRLGNNPVLLWLFVLPIAVTIMLLSSPIVVVKAWWDRLADLLPEWAETFSPLNLLFGFITFAWWLGVGIAIVFCGYMASVYGVRSWEKMQEAIYHRAWIMRQVTESMPAGARR